MKIIKSFISILPELLLLSGCAVTKQTDHSQLPFTIQILKNTRSVVLTQTLPWEEQMMGYFNVLQIRPGFWQMWYSSWDNQRKDDYSDYLVYAYSTDGKNWVKEIPGRKNNILKGSGPPHKDGVVEQDVFMEPHAEYRYKMIYTAKDSGDRYKEKTFVEESKDGINWVHKKVLWNEKHDSQFSVVQQDSLYYIYLRHWVVKDNVRYRTIGLAVTDKNWNTIEKPHNILSSVFNGNFPHLYNPAASKISDDLTILFPTFFNQKTNAVQFGLAYVYRNQPVLTNRDFTKDLLEGENSNWGIVSPGLIPAGKNTYWMYYYATNMVHSDYDQSGRKFTYYRIKVRIKEKR